MGHQLLTAHQDMVVTVGPSADFTEEVRNKIVDMSTCSYQKRSKYLDYH